MSLPQKIFVASTSFSHSEILRTELLSHFPNTVFNHERQLNALEFEEAVRGFEGVIVGLDEINEKMLSGHPELKIVSKFGVGIDNIDVDACKRHEVKIGWTPGTNRLDVAEHTLALIIGIARNILLKHQELKKGLWKKNGGHSLSELTVGIVGLGNIGKELVRFLHFFGSKILVHDLVYDDEFCHKYDLTKVSKEELLRQADIVTLHIPLTKETYYYISDSEFGLMKNNAWIINTSRGKNVERNALKRALEQKLIAGAALDVFEEEPCEDIDLLAFPNLISTPHIAGNSQRAVLSMGRSSIAHLVDHFSKKVLS